MFNIQFRNDKISLFLSALIIGLSLDSCTGRATLENDWEKQQLKGQVAQIKVTYAQARQQNGEWEMGALPHNEAMEELRFNEKGMLQSIRYLDSKGAQQRAYNYMYNDLGQNDVTLQYYEDSVAIYRIEKSFANNESNKPVKSETTDLTDKSKAGSKQWTYDEEERLIKIEDFNSYNKINNVVEQDWEGDLMVEFRRFIPHEKSVTRYVYTYNEEGKVISKKGYLGNTLHTSEKMEYDERGQISKIIREDVLSNSRESLIISCWYDEAGNWVKKVIREEGSDEGRMTGREIQYY